LAQVELVARPHGGPGPHLQLQPQHRAQVAQAPSQRACRARARTFRFKQCSTAATTSAASSHAAQAAGLSPRPARQALNAYARLCCQVFGQRMAMRDVRLGGAEWVAAKHTYRAVMQSIKVLLMTQHASQQ